MVADVNLHSHEKATKEEQEADDVMGTKVLKEPLQMGDVALKYLMGDYLKFLMIRTKQHMKKLTDM